MAGFNPLSTRTLLWSAFSYGLALVQGATLTSSAADGLTTTAGHASASSGTVLVGGMTSTFRVIPTLPASVDETPPILANIYDPKAIDAQVACPGYRASGVKTHKFGFTATLSMAGKACNAYGTDIETLALKVQYQSADRLRVRIRPMHYGSNNASHYVLPSKYVYEPTLDEDASNTVQTNDLQFTWTNQPSFGFSVIRKSTGDVLFDTKGTKIVYQNQFIEFVTAMPENYNVYGLGEVIHGLRLGNNVTRTMYNADAGDPLDGNIYGTHPFYLDTRYYEKDAETGDLTLVTSTESDSSKEYVSMSHGVFLRNAHGQEVLLRSDTITWRTLGGSIDLFFLGGPTQPEVTKQYQLGVLGGYPVMQQYWTFGYHQCRWGYNNISDLEFVIDNMRKFDIPVETVWNDIDYMNQYRDFDNDQIRFGYDESKVFLDKLHANGQHYVPIVDAAIYIPNSANSSDAYETYTRGHASGSFLMNPDGSEYIGAVWPGYTVFADWRANSTQDWWSNEVKLWHDNFNFDGIWLDMSEASSFCVGSCGSGKTAQNPVHPPFGLPGEVGSVIYDYPEDFAKNNRTEYKSAQSASKAQASSVSATATPTSTQPYMRTTPTPGVRSLDFPPYALNNINGALPVHALAPRAMHADGTREYDIHNLYGHDHLIGTYNALLTVSPKKRPFIIARSNFAGSGRYAGHWGGDNTSLFFYMYHSIPQALTYSLFGIPMFGVDTCGFNGNSDEELCNRWMMLSAFFPFYRNHNTLSANSQEPYMWSSVAEASKKAMNIRYSILPYMYTLFYLSHTTGSTVMRALSWEFPNEPVLANADRQFMLGPAIMVTPVLDPLARTVDGVFPGVGYGTVWYDWYTQSAVKATAGQNMTIAAPLSHLPLYVRGGSVVPMQEPGYTTAESRRNPWSLLVALDLEGSATGQLYLDDGESLEPQTTRFVDLTVSENSLYASGRGLFKDTNALSNVTILGVPKAPTGAKLNGRNVGSVSYNRRSKSVSITGLDSATKGGAWKEDWVLSWTF